MRQFNTPPGWPDPPNARWRPPKRWGPAEAWPPAPDGWRFWVDEDGRPVRGPIGLYGGPSIVKLSSFAAVVLALIGLVLFNPFTSDDSTPTAAPTTTETAPAEGTTVAPETPTPAGATTAPTTKPTSEPTAEPTSEPTAQPTPTATEPKTSAPPRTTPTPTKPSSAPTTTAVVYKNCAEVRAAGKAPLHRGDPGYSDELDNNGDGTACGRGNS